jgi:hypothetical protein
MPRSPASAAIDGAIGVATVAVCLLILWLVLTV